MATGVFWIFLSSMGYQWFFTMLKGGGIRYAWIYISNATFVYASGSKASCCSKHRFTVNLRRDGLSNNEATFYAPFTSAKTVSLGGGFSTSSSYLVEISNNDNLPSGIYLSGSGTVEN